MSKHSAAEETAALQEDEQAEHRAVLRQRGFKAFLVARLGAVFAMQIQAVVVVWQIYDLTQNPLSLAYAGLAQFIPMLLLLLPAGDLVDRYRRKYILILSWLLQGLCSGLLWQLSRSPDVPVEYYYLVLALFGCGRAFTGPTLQSLLPQIVPRVQLAQAIAVNSMSMKMAVSGGPRPGGVRGGLGGGPAHAVRRPGLGRAAVALSRVH